VLDEVNPGRWLRQKREQLTGKWQGPLGVPRGSIVICMALGSPADELATELLVRLVCGEKIDARHFSSADIDAGLPPGADPDGVAVVFLVSAFPSPERERADSISRRVHELLPQANVIRVLCPGVGPLAKSSDKGIAEPTAGSLGEAVQISVSWQRRAVKRAFSHRKHELRGVRGDDLGRWLPQRVG
jgi:hypothetical protein